ncbi:hypothetical protein [Halomonas sp. NO4]|uniref:hypothetical protein n=1 Tax=Halomonas sp. NO4 TaxID=2484813 RepID=UPI0013D69FE6|nr:hypothetical protein [Halomonas sp. NO4]
MATQRIKVYRIRLVTGQEITMLDMEGRGLDHARESVKQRFGHDQVASVEPD